MSPLGLCSRPGVPPGKSFARPETAAAFLATPADFGRQRPHSPASPASKPRKVKDYSVSARKANLRGTAWWGWQDSNSQPSDYGRDIFRFIGLDGLAITSCHAYVGAMTMPIDQNDYSVVVKHRAPPPKSWRWEIYRAGRRSPIEQSSVYFHTMAAANRAGREALKQLLDKLHAEHLRWPAA